jgi:hypothetical protein
MRQVESGDCNYMEAGVLGQELLLCYYSAFTQAHISQHLVSLEAASAPAPLRVSRAEAASADTWARRAGGLMGYFDSAH